MAGLVITDPTWRATNLLHIWRYQTSVKK